MTSGLTLSIINIGVIIATSAVVLFIIGGALYAKYLDMQKSILKKRGEMKKWKSQT